MKVDLTAMFASYAKDSLGALAEHHGVALRGDKKERLVELLAEKLFTEERTKQALAALRKRDRQVLDRLVLRGGMANNLSFRRDLLRTGLIVKSPRGTRYNDERYRGLPERGDSNYFEDVIARLGLAALVFSSGLAPGYGGATMLHLGMPGEVIFIPDEVLAHLPPVTLPSPDPPAIAAADVREAAPQTLQRDIYLYWRFARRNELALTTRGLVPKRLLGKIAEGLVVAEDVDAVAGEQELARTYFLRRLLEDLGLLLQQQGRLLPAPESLAFLELPFAERIRRCYQAWLGSARWNELLRIPDLAIDFGNNAHRDGTPLLVQKARQAVVALLAALPAERWISLAQLWERASLVNGDFLFPREKHPAESRYYGYHDRHPDQNPYERSGNALGWTFTGLEDDEQGWRTVEGGFIVAILREPLHWLGLVALGYEQDRLAAFRLSALGARLIRGEALPSESAPAGQVVVQPNFQIFAFDPIGEHILAMLDRFAELVRADQALEFRLTRESVYRAQQEGMPVSAVASFLEQASGRPLPQNVQRTLLEWASHHDRIVVRRGVSVLHSATPELLDALLADDQLDPQLGRRLAPTAAAIAHGAKGLNRLASALLARGHLPALSRDGGAAAKGAIAIAADGRIAFHQRLPSIYVWRRLAPLAEHREGALWITPASVQRAGDGGLGAEQLIEQLAAVHLGPLPAAVADRIKVWAKHWGDATLAAITLLRVKDDAILAELMADPAIGPLLQPYVPRGAGALVRPENIARLRDALAAKGIDVLDR